MSYIFDELGVRLTDEQYKYILERARRIGEKKMADRYGPFDSESIGLTSAQTLGKEAFPNKAKDRELSLTEKLVKLEQEFYNFKEEKNKQIHEMATAINAMSKFIGMGL